MLRLSYRAHLLLPLSLLLVLQGYHQLIRLQARRPKPPKPHQAAESKLLEPADGDPISANRAAALADSALGQMHQDRQPPPDGRMLEQRHGHVEQDLPSPDGSQHGGSKPPEFDMQPGSPLALSPLWIVESCHRIGQAVFGSLGKAPQIDKHHPAEDHQHLEEHSEVKGDWATAAGAQGMDGNQTSKRKGVKETEHVQLAGEGQQVLEQDLQDVQKELRDTEQQGMGGLEQEQQGFEVEQGGVVDQEQEELHNQPGDLQQVQQMLHNQHVDLQQEQQEQFHSQQGGADEERIWQHLKMQQGNTDEVQQQQHQGDTDEVKQQQHQGEDEVQQQQQQGDTGVQQQPHQGETDGVQQQQHQGETNEVQQQQHQGETDEVPHQQHQGKTDEVQQQNHGQQGQCAGQPRENQGALNARLAAVLSAAHTWLMGEWRSAQLGLATLAYTAQSKDGHTQVARAVRHQAMAARDAGAEAMKAWMQHVARAAGASLFAAHSWVDAWMQAAAGQMQELLKGVGGEEPMSRATEARLLLLWKKWGPWGSYWAAEGARIREQHAHLLALPVVLVLIGGVGLLVLHMLWRGARQILLQQYQQGWEAASMEAAAALVEARQQGRAAAAQAEKQAALAAAQHAAQLQQHCAAAMATAAAAEHAAAAVQRSAAAGVAVLRAEHEAWADEVQSGHAQELVEVASRHNHQLAELYQLHQGRMADVCAAAASEKESLQLRHSQEAQAQRRQLGRLMKAWLLARQQQELVCKHLKQRAEVQVHEQQIREEKLASELHQARVQHSARCKDIAMLEGQLEQLQLSLEEAQLELAARGQQLLDMSAIIKSKDNLIAQHKAIMNELQQRLQDTDEALRSSELHVLSLEGDLQQNQARLDEELRQNQDLQHQLSALPKYESRLVEAAQQMHALLAKHAALQTAVKDSASCVADRDAKIEEQTRCAQEDKAAHEQQAREMQKRLDALSAEFTRVVEAKDKELQLRHADNRMLKEELTKVETEMRRQRTSQSANAPNVLKTSMYVR
ncbi:hypothetical protein DUNSADRAFT_7546 [Dunaliella salina]|uniref:Uncharacterized protein n=1 Tax=Dunaliella salina TaxID=3046 RepID=A0ABQ7GLA7_DUNSA|nr:hypothetical protein DUNSADRAFT_7546 [Dunaliella salina]|eukprot:KAF5835351.1 hypothetical protein DUNSADRAFT_7546 [Dunaliella salina]